MIHLDKYLKDINQLAERYSTSIFLTGGAVRDLFLELPVNDFDFTLNKYTEKISRKFASKVGGSHIELDQQRKIFRVVKDDIRYDFTQFRGKNIEDDLLKRDFTINSLAISANKFFHLTEIMNKRERLSESLVFDPTGGLKDLKERRIRALGPDVFVNDPLRLLRAVRLKGRLDFQIESSTEDMICRNRNLIKSPAFERIRDELYKIFSFDNTEAIVKYMEESLGLFYEIFPDVKQMKKRGKCRYHREDIWTHSLYMIKLFQKIKKDELLTYIPERSKEPLIKFAALFHDIGKLFTETEENGVIHFYGHASVGAEWAEKIFSELRFSNDEINYIKRLIKYHMQPLYLYNDEKLSDKMIYRFFARAGDFAEDILLLSALDLGSSRILNGKKEKALRYWEYINRLFNKYDNMVKSSDNLFLDGEDVMEIMNIKEGPEVGRVLQELKRAQALGKVESTNEAVDYIKTIKEE